MTSPGQEAGKIAEHWNREEMVRECRSAVVGRQSGIRFKRWNRGTQVNQEKCRKEGGPDKTGTGRNSFLNPEQQPVRGFLQE